MSGLVHRRGLITAAAAGLIVPSLVRAATVIPQPRRFWSPKLIPTLVEAWYDAEAQIGADAASLSTFKDRSGLGRDAAATTGVTSVATMKFNQINGRKTVEFSHGINASTASAHNSYDIPSAVLSGATQGSVMAVLQRKTDPAVSDAEAGIYIAGVTGENSVASHWPYLDGNIYDGFGSTARKTVGNPTPSLTSARIYSAHSAASDWRAYLDGTNLFTTATNTVGFSANMPRNIGRMYNNSFWYGFHGYVGEILLFNSVLTTANRQLVEGYLGWKWGLQANLPGGHPWKTSRP